MMAIGNHTLLIISGQNLCQVGGKVVSGAEEEDDDEEESGGEEEHPAVRGGRSRCLDS